MTSEIKNIIIVDDNQHFIEAVKLLIKTHTSLNIVAEANNAGQFFDIIKHTTADLVLMDINMPETNGLQAGEKSIKINKELKILGVTMSDDHNIHRNMMRTGFCGGLLKNQFSKNLTEAIQAITKGEKYFPLLGNKTITD